MHPAAAAIRIAGVNKYYGSSQVLRDVGLTCEVGDVLAIAGENGAGKSTLVKIISGVIPVGSYEGDVLIHGMKAAFGNVRDAERSGVFMVPQELSIVPELSIADFLFLNREPLRCGIIDQRRLWTETARWLEIFRLENTPLTKMGELGSHEQQLVSIARAMTQGVKILILDEPTASLSGRETDLLFDRVRAFKNLGVTTLYISHRLAEFEAIADAVTVMRDGRVVDGFRIASDGRRLDGGTARRVVTAMVGHELKELYPKAEPATGNPIFKLSNWTLAHPSGRRRELCIDVSFEVRAGEVVGIFGLIGSGASDLARSIFGAHPGAVTGIARLHDRPIRLDSPRAAMAAGVAYLPSDRKRDGLVLQMPISGNLTLAALGDFVSGGIVDRERELHKGRDTVVTLRVKCNSIEQPIGELSGGNQQKVAAAKWMLTSPQLVVFEEPTRGVDVGARVEIYNLINELAQQGKAILIVSTDLAEVIGMSDRVFAMHAGRIAGEWQRGAVDERSVMLAASGSSEELAP
jgi:ABC-type sugar transport system ATPase subunit